MSSVGTEVAYVSALPYPSGLPIGNRWVPPSSWSPVTFPFDGTTIAQAPVGDVLMARTAVDEAVAVAPEVAALPSHCRRNVLSAVHHAILEQREQFEELLVLETGKPLVDCRVEVDRTILTMAMATEVVAQLHGETVPLDLLPAGDGLLGFWTRRPIGVVVGIAGFNYPLLLAVHKIAPALAAGCPVICKPAPQTPLATLWMTHLFRSALDDVGGPPSAVQLITGGADVGSALVTDRRIGAVSFTGSATIGHQIARDAAPKKVLLELGSNSALIVAEDADVNAAVDAILRGAFYASGQACISVQRVIVVGHLFERVVDLLISRIASVSTGDPRDERTRVSALINEQATARVSSWIADAVERGADILAGGGVVERVLQPTVLLNVPDGTDIWDEEVFGPVVCLRSVGSFEEAVVEVNRSRYGLHASVFTQSLATAFTALDKLEVGGVVINDLPGFRGDAMPYGGVKDSGVGREGPRFAAEEFTTTKMAIMRPL
jgi:acyl-CoA reductase-like NAD-dependent aldehyde dehydrogenase